MLYGHLRGLPLFGHGGKKLENMNSFLLFLMSVAIFTIGYYIQYSDYKKQGKNAKLFTSSGKSMLAYLLLLISSGGIIKLIQQLRDEGEIQWNFLDLPLVDNFIFPAIVGVLMVICPTFYAFYSSKDQVP